MPLAKQLLDLLEAKVETFILIGKERFTPDQFKKMIGRSSSVSASLQDLVDDYNKETKRDARIVLYKNGKEILR